MKTPWNTVHVNSLQSQGRMIGRGVLKKARGKANVHMTGGGLEPRNSSRELAAEKGFPRASRGNTALPSSVLWYRDSFWISDPQNYKYRQKML
ncbi:hypothetical protein LEMLEM_LOCUS6214 [Lemmus lemmus]